MRYWATVGLLATLVTVHVSAHYVLPAQGFEHEVIADWFVFHRASPGVRSLLTAPLFHVTDVHIVGNLLMMTPALVILDHKFASKTVVALYALTAISAVVTWYLVSTHTGHEVASAGASGASYGLMCLSMLLAWNDFWSSGFTDLRLVSILLLLTTPTLLAVELWTGVAHAPTEYVLGIPNVAHIVAVFVAIYVWSTMMALDGYVESVQITTVPERPDPVQ